MNEISNISLFITSSILLAIAPGPDNLFVLTQSMIYGRKSGFCITLGLCTGLIVHTLLVTFGVALLFKTSPFLFTIIKFAGVLYLLYLAIMHFYHMKRVDTPGDNQQLSLISLYKRGIIMNITNPKVSLFFMSYLPQFIDPSASSISLPLFILGLVFIFIALVLFFCISIIAGQIGSVLKKSQSINKGLHVTAGISLIILAIILLQSSI